LLLERQAYPVAAYRIEPADTLSGEN